MKINYFFLDLILVIKFDEELTENIIFLNI